MERDAARYGDPAEGVEARAGRAEAHAVVGGGAVPAHHRRRHARRALRPSRFAHPRRLLAGDVAERAREQRGRIPDAPGESQHCGALRVAGARTGRGRGEVAGSAGSFAGGAGEDSQDRGIADGERVTETKMDQNIEQLVAEVAAVTGAQLPGVLDEHGPVLRDAKGDGGEFYLVGLIGGKEVGKSALVNALVGQPITDSTSYGPGTETAIAYAHEAQAGAVKELLEREARGRYKIVTHTLPHLHRQVLLD